MSHMYQLDLIPHVDLPPVANVPYTPLKPHHDIKKNSKRC